MTMTREELDEMKHKHRTDEQKAILKADMDYLKGMIKQQSAGHISQVSYSSISASLLSTPMMSLPSVSAPVSVSIDVQV